MLFMTSGLLRPRLVFKDRSRLRPTACRCPRHFLLRSRSGHRHEQSAAFWGLQHPPTAPIPGPIKAAADPNSASIPRVTHSVASARSWPTSSRLPRHFMLRSRSRHRHEQTAAFWCRQHPPTAPIQRPIKAAQEFSLNAFQLGIK
mgnify:CR=1 FL=1